MVKLQLILNYLNKEFNTQSYDRKFNGLLVSGTTIISHIGLAVNSSFQTIESAIKKKIDLLIVHHPPFASEDIDLRHYKIKMLKKHKINLFALHEALDCHKTFGTSALITKLFNLQIIGTFNNKKGLPIGLITKIKINSNDLIKRFKKFNCLEMFIYNSQFKYIAVAVGYNGKPYIMYQAKKNGCDTLITGETHMLGRLYAKESKLNLICLGHYQSERFAIDNLVGILREKFLITTSLIDEDALN